MAKVSILLEKWHLKMPYNWTTTHYVTQLRKRSLDRTKTKLPSERQRWGVVVGGGKAWGGACAIWLHVYASNIHLNIKKAKHNKGKKDKNEKELEG